MYPNQADHDPSDLNAAVTIIRRDDTVPIGLFFRDPDRPRYEQATVCGMDMPSADKLAAVEKELDRFTI
jgi:hypothetical protein